jgi:hypothetical protein
MTEDYLALTGALECLLEGLREGDRQQLILAALILNDLLENREAWAGQAECHQAGLRGEYLQ